MKLKFFMSSLAVNNIFMLTLALLFAPGCFSQEVYLSDLGWFSEENSVSEMGLKKAQINKNFDGGPIQLWGISYDKGIGMHAKGEVMYSLHGEYEWFLASIGIDDKAGKSGSCVFRVIGDGKMLYESKVLKGGSGIEDLRIGIKGIDKLEFQVDDADDGTTGDLADWGGARVLSANKSINWDWLKDYQGYYQSGNSVHCKYVGQEVVFVCYSDNIIRIRHASSGVEDKQDADLGIKSRKWCTSNLKTIEEPDFIDLITDSLLLRIHKSPYGVDFLDKKSGKTITSHSNQTSYGFFDNLKTIRFQMDASGKKESFYGGGVRFEEFDLRGKSIRNWGTYINSPRTTGEVEVTIPLILSTNGYGILLNNSFESRFKFGSEIQNLAEYTVSDGSMDYFFIRGDLKQIVKNYFEITGYPDMPLIKAMGLNFRGRETFKSANPGNQWDAGQYLAVVNEFKQHQIQLAALGTEPGWSTGRGNLIWSKDVFPDPAGWCRELHDHDLLVNHWIYGKVNSADTILYRSMKPFMNEQGYADVLNKKGMDIYFNFLKHKHFDVGIDGFKEDSHAKKITAEMTFPSGKTGLELHNNYWTLWLSNIYTRYRQTYNKRLNSYIASGFTGIQKFCPVIYADYLDRLDGVSRAINSTGWFGLLYSPEIQGYYIPDDRQYMRMTQIAALSPSMVHNEWMGGELPWNRPLEVYRNYLKYVRLHRELIPYFYSYAWIQHHEGLSLIRPLPLEFQNDTNTFHVETQYMIGKYLMVVPVWNKNQNFENCDIYFPKGANWYDYETGDQYKGGTWLRDQKFPLDKLPLFVRDGAIIPRFDYGGSTDENQQSKLFLDFFPEDKSSFALYEDDGKTYMYEKGDYSLINITCDVDKSGLYIEIPTRGKQFSGISHERYYEVRIHLFNNVPEKLFLNKSEVPLNYDGKVLSFVCKEQKNNIKIQIEYKLQPN